MSSNELLSDYGTCIEFLFPLIKTNMSLKEIIKISNKKELIIKTLMILIQKRLVNFYTHPTSKEVYYNVNLKNSERRRYFSLYTDYIDRHHNKVYTEMFIKVLTSGICKVDRFKDAKIIIKMVEINLLQLVFENFGFLNYGNLLQNDEEEQKKIKLISDAKFVVVNFEEIEKNLINEYFSSYIKNRYGIDSKKIFDGLLTSSSFMNKKKSKKELESKDTEKSDEFCEDIQSENSIFFLKNEGIIIDSVLKGNYNINYKNIINILKKKEVTKMIDRFLNPKCKRIFNCVFEKKYLDDKDLIKITLLDSKQARLFSFELYKNGYVHLSSIQKESKNASVWEIDIQKTSKLCAVNLEKYMEQKTKLIDNYWEKQHYKGNDSSDDRVHISDFIGMAKDHFIFKY